MVINCPRDGEELTPRKVKGRETEVDFCSTCRGIWFDDGEVASVIGARSAGRLEIPFTAAAISARCPRCDERLLVFPYPDTLTIIDACASCHGVWIDRGEIQSIERARPFECPKCGFEQPQSGSCASCGVIFAKYFEVERARADGAIDEGTEYEGTGREGAGREAAEPSDEIPGIKGKVIRFIDDSLEAMLGGLME